MNQIGSTVTDRTDAIRARRKKATPGPWKVMADVDGFGICHIDGTHVTKREAITREADADFIAHAPQDIADLLAENAKLRRVVEAVKELETEWRSYADLMCDKTIGAIQRRADADAIARVIAEAEKEQT
jgi:hypothetical protein